MPENRFDYLDFSKRIPTWAGKIETSQPEFLIYQKLPFNNICTIDYLLMAVWFSTKFNPSIIDIIQDKAVSDEMMNTILQIIKLIDRIEWDKARTIWILKVLNLEPNGTDALSFSLFEGESSYFY